MNSTQYGGVFYGDNSYLFRSDGHVAQQNTGDPAAAYSADSIQPGRYYLKYS